MSLIDRVRAVSLAATGKLKPTSPSSFAAEQYFPFLTDPTFAIPSIDDLVRQKGVAIYREMQDQDDMVAACLGCLRLARISSGWEVSPASGDEVDKKVSDCFSYDLARLQRGSIDRTLYEILDGIGVGFSAIEKIWKEPYVSGPWAGKQGFSEFISIPQETVAIKRDAHGRIESDGVWQAKPGLSVSGTLDPAHFFKMNLEDVILFSWETRYGNPLGRSILRPAFPWYFIKKTAVKWWARHLEFFGLPFLLGVVSKNATAGAKKELLEVLKNYQGQQRGVMTEGTKIEVKEPGTTVASNHDLLISRCDRGIARSILTPSTLMDSPEVGAYALGKEHKSTYVWVQTYIGTLIEREVFGLQVARPFVDHNFGTEIDVPNFKFKAFSDPDLVALSTIVKTLCDVGFPIPPDWIEKAFGIPQAEDGEPSLGKSLPADTGNPLAGFPDVVSQEDEALTALSLDLFEAAGDPTGDDAVNVLRGQGKRSKVYARDLYGEGALSR